MTNIATPYTKEGIAHRNRQTVPCPRCMEPCGWCSDPRWMHATLKLPGSKKRCGVPGYEPEGKDCPLCHGAMKVWRHVAYETIPINEKDPPHLRSRASKQHHSGEVSEPCLSASRAQAGWRYVSDFLLIRNVKGLVSQGRCV